MKSVNKEAFLNAINGGLDFYKFVLEDLEQVDDLKCKKCKNPFYDDTVPSLSIYVDDKKDKWLFFDHGFSDTGKQYRGDVFDFAAHYYHCDVKRDFQTLLGRMADDLKVDLVINGTLNGYNRAEDVLDYYNGDGEDYRAWLRGFELVYNADGFSAAHAYFKDYGITLDILKEYNVRAISAYKQAKGQDGVRTHYCKKQQLVIAYEDLKFAKLYSPDPKAFWYAGKKSNDYVFGYEQICRRRRKQKLFRDLLIVTSGEKDVLTLTSLGFDAVCFNSETAKIPLLAMEELFPIYQHIKVLYDNDTTGQKQAQFLVNKLGDKFSISAHHLPSELKEAGGKDISDYVKKGFDVVRLKNDLSEYDRPVQADLLYPEETDGASLFPNSVFENIPEVLKITCDQFIDPRDRDLICLASIAVLSSLFPKVKGIYDGSEIGCNLYLFVSAPASAGKGVMSWGRRLGTRIQKHLQEKYMLDLSKYEFDLQEYEIRKNNNPDVQKPVSPERQTLFIPANSSMSKIVEFLGANQNFGIIFETEGDVLTNTLSNEWGDFSSVLRQAFHHEAIALARRTNNEFIEIDKPHLSVLLTGTPDQSNRLFKTVENGFFSRFLYYDFKADIKWKNQFGTKETTLENTFDELADIMLGYWTLQIGSPTTKIYINPFQINDINEYFENKLMKFYSEHGDPITANVKRACLIFYRIAMIFSILRWLEENGKLPDELEVCDADLKAAFGIVDTLFYHLQKVYCRIENAGNTAKLNMKQKMLFEALPMEFTRSSYDSIAEGLKIKYKTAERYLDKYIINELIERYEQGKYRRA